MNKKILFAILCSVSLIACRSKSQDKDRRNKQAASSAKSDTAETQALINKIKPALAGLWMNKEYIDEIKRTKSPQQAYGKVGNVTGILIDPSKIKSDTLSLYCNSGFHEAISLTIKFDPDIFKNTITVHDFTTGKKYWRLRLNETGKLLTLYRYDEQSKSIERIQLSKAPVTNSQDGDPNLVIINQVLISGNYIATDSLKNSFKVSFTDDGKVKGLNNFKTYEVLADFTTPPNNLDEIGFDIDKQRKWYGFKINADTLNIYETRDAADSISLLLTNLKYKLVRQK